MDNARYISLLEQIADVDNLGYMIDRLICACIKLAKFDEMAQKERNSEVPNLDRIAFLAEQARITNEDRHALVNAIDAKIAMCVDAGEYKYRKDTRTFEVKK